ncbi:MAG: hypothetical protein COZ06_29010 [Armatimonadetes bacterium CG_4_10_14_3_um_filter_66_18]|nr:excisionase family DNA-binding protein [Armatimonadota bacterium]PIU88851.1 MAG: hypothetical protein COS65_30010 [Armatimonadetes bacterium CG06_land_8_20_14_3_00_66_21]PIW12756.1 MAG: hypothetical protein COW34_13445 [Armatimonadetes bacterium CG17_big_fil_post_rev_8_21_14_2_50_66_6]PIX46950.1 MAG: hypothetical protein COZ57_09795 [Armatimonadetes bacterium CG_4_8_14_3_um_filter_66_20]PIY39894.1 MAG: hypothetical protein COZ06_29010 [Armatimonadetes bacterium CG_4_10_14_3_um_filter_66_18]
MQLLSTGQAAKLCSVTPDAVLKWIKAGKVRAQRTAGGHYRIQRESLETLLGDKGELRVERPSERAASPPSRFCWEFYSQDGALRADCQQCLVYRSRALRCFEMSHLGEADGYKGTFCETSCDRCSYFRSFRPAPIRVLVVTNSETVERSLRQSDDGWFDFRFTGCEYDCSALVGSFRPECIVVDCALPPDQCQALCRHLSADPRVSGTTILLTTSPEQEGVRPRFGFAELGEPLSVQSLRRRLEELGAATERSLSGALAARPRLECALLPL